MPLIRSAKCNQTRPYYKERGVAWCVIVCFVSIRGLSIGRQKLSRATDYRERKRKETTKMVAMVADPYQTLGLGHDASKEDIKKAYRGLAMRLHPDRLTRNGASEEEIRRYPVSYCAMVSPRSAAAR